MSIASGSATPSISAYAASLMNGIRMRLETNPGKSRASAGALPRSSASATIAAAVSSDVCTAADHLDELQHRHGVEEVHADHLLRAARGRGERRDRDRGGVRGEDRLVAGAASSARAEDRPSSRPRPRRRPRSGGRPATMSSTGSTRAEHLVGVARRPSRRASEALPHGLERALGRPGDGVVERDAPARRGDDLCDPPPIWPAPTTRTCSNCTRGVSRAYGSGAPGRSRPRPLRSRRSAQARTSPRIRSRSRP